MQLTDLFIKRPVLATVISLFILAMGLRSIFSLPIMQYPFTENAQITVMTAFTGADPATVAGFITTPLENALSQVDGIDYMTSSSTPGASTITINLKLNYDTSKALAAVNTQVNSVLNQLPKASQLPMISVSVGETIDSMYIGFYSDVLKNNQITDYLIRIVQPKLQAVDGVQQAQILGEKEFALRAWLDPTKLAGFGIAPSDVASALANNNFISAAGRTDGNMVVVNFTANTNLLTLDQFRRMVIKQQNGAIIRLGDLGNVELGAENYNSAVSFDGKDAVYVGIELTPTANLLTVVQNIRNLMPEIESQLPEGLKANIVYDASAYVNSSIDEVIKSLVEAFLIVTIVIFIFLGSVRAVITPLVAIPLSLIGAFFIMLILGYSINLLTLLALVLAIGLVVDDAIIVVENVQRHMEEGKSAWQASIIGARELAGPIIAISVVLIAVYVPIGFMGGLTGALFTEFAFTLAGVVGISAVVALTLSPMMCSKFLTHTKNKSRFIQFVDYHFARLEKGYSHALHQALKYLPVLVVFAIIILLSNYFLFVTSRAELAPQEDQGIIISQLTAAPNASLDQTHMYAKLIDKIYTGYPELDHSFQIDGSGGLNISIVGMVLKAWDQRSRTTNELQPIIQNQENQITGGKVAAFQPPSLPGGGSGLPIQFVITTTDTFDSMNTVVQSIIDAARQSGKFMYIDPDLKLDMPQTNILIDRDKAADMGLNMQDVGNLLGYALSEGYINYFNYAGRSYQVIPQTIRNERVNSSQILGYYIKAPNAMTANNAAANSNPTNNSTDNSSVALSTIAKMNTTVVPESINHFQQLNSATISAIAFPGVTMGDALATFKQIAQQNLPQGYSIDYASQSRQFIQEGSSLVTTFFFALIIIFLSLAALFESFRDPLIVLISVPMSICGAMIFVSLDIGGATLNIYSEVGLVTLIGLISKHGILIVQFANDLQLEGKTKLEAIEMAANIRLRPILMTTFAMVLGVIPLITASGAGALSRFNIGLVIATGISIGTCFTLFVVPGMYMLLAQDHSKKALDELKDSGTKDLDQPKPTG